VGREFISYDELASECVSRHGAEILDNLINRKIIQQACDQQGIEVGEGEVNQEIQRISKKFGLDPGEWLKMLQAERNVTPAQYRRDIIWPMLALKKLAGEEIKITKKDLRVAFERHYGTRVKARAIILDNSRRAREVWDKAQADPENFEKLVREYSVDSTSRALDGQIPPIARHSGHKELETAAFKLKEGEISAVVQVGLNQFIILKSEGLTETAVSEISEVENELREQLHEEKVQESVARIFEKLKDDARVDNYLTGVSTGGERKTASGRFGAPAAGKVRPASGTNEAAPRGAAEDDAGVVPAQGKRSNRPASAGRSGRQPAE
jgi:foldase protein PrsA